MFVQNFLKPKLRAMSMANLTCPTKSWFYAVAAHRRLYSLGPRRTHTTALLKGFSFSCSASSSSSSSVLVRRSRNAASSFSSPHFYQHNYGYGRFAYDEYASEDSDGEYQPSSKQQVTQCFSFVYHVEKLNCCFSAYPYCFPDFF